MATPLATAFVRIRPDTSGFEKETKAGLSKAGRGVAQEGKKHGRLFGATFAKSTAGPFRAIGGVLTSSLAGIGGAFAAIGIAKFGKDAIGAASDLNESMSKVNVVFGKSAGIITGWSKNSATALGISRQQALEAAGTFGNLFVAMKIGQPAATSMSRGIIELSSDLASFNNANPADVLEALRSGLVGETEPLRKFGINLNDAALRQEALKLGLVKTTKEVLPPAAKAQAAYALIMQQSRTAQGDFARTSGGLANQQRILAARFTDVKAAIGKGLLPVVIAVTSFISTQVVPAIAKFSQGLGSKLQPIVATISRFIKTDLVPAVKALAGFITASVVPAVRQWLGIIAKALLPTLKALGEIWKQNIRPALKGLFEAVQRNWPAFKRLATIILVVAGFILKYLLPVIIRVAGVIISYWIRNITLQIKIMGVLIRWIITAGKAIGTFAVATARHFVQWYNAARDAVLKVVAFFRGLPGRITSAVGGLGTLLYNRGKAVVTGFWNGIKDAWASVISWFKGLPKKILGALGIHSPPDWAIDAGRHIMTGLLKGIVPGGKALLAYGKGIVSSLSATLGGPQIRFGGGGGAISGSPMEIAQKMVPEWATGAQWRAWYDLWNNESGWNPLADNPTSTAFGIPQFIASTARAYGVYGSTDPARQIAAGAQYISDRYGDPIHAWAHWTKFRSYDRGGWLMPGATLAINKTGRPERISPPGAGGNTYTINISVPPSANQHDIGRQIVGSIRAYEKGSGSGWRK